MTNVDPESPSAPPHDLAGERALLGALIATPEAMARVEAIAEESTFAFPEHRALFAELRARHEHGLDATLFALRPWAEQHLDGGARYLVAIASAGAWSGEVEALARALRWRWQRRRALTLAADLEHAARDESTLESFDDLATTMADSLDALTREGGRSPGMRKLGDVARKVWKTLEQAYARGEGIAGLSTGLRDLDRLLGGLKRADLVIVAGRPSMGKSALALCLARNVAQGGNVAAVYSLEMSADQLALRLYAIDARVPMARLQAGDATAPEMDATLSAMDGRESLPLYLDDTGALTVAQIRARARALKRKHGLALLVVDYVQLIEAPGYENRVQAVTAITRGLKALAKELDVPVVALSQLSRAVEGRTDKRPQLSDLRESGSIEQDADVVALLYREAYYLERGTPEERDRARAIAHLAEVHIAKNRNGPTGVVHLAWDGRFMEFADLDENQ